MTSISMRSATIAVTLVTVLSASGCAHVRRTLGLEPPGPLPTDVPTAAFAGTDRMFVAPGQPDGRFERVTFPTAGVMTTVAPGDSAVLLDLPGPAIVRRVRITLANPDPHWLRRVALRMHWDGEAEPSVHVPLGDFFGNAFERRAYASLATGVTAEGFYSYLPMPFAGRARIVLENGTGLPIEGLAFDADIESGATLTEPVATLHAFWSRDPRPRPDRLHRAVDVSGQGWFVGTALSAQGHEGSFDFLRGSGVFRVDGRTLDSSTVAAYLGASAGVEGAIAGPLQGAALRDGERARLAAYRWHLADPIPFRDSFRLELERGRANRDGAEYATVAYWYQTEPHDLPRLPGPHERRVPEVLVPPGALWGDEVDVIGMGRGTLRMALPVPRADRYEVVVYAEASPGAESPTVSVVGSSGPGRVVEVSASGAEPGDVLPGVVVDTVSVSTRTVDLQLEAGGAGIAVPAAVRLRPLSGWAERWWAIGTWPSPGVSDPEAGLSFIWGPDDAPELDRVHELPEGRVVAWEPLDAGSDGTVELAPRGGTAYAQAFLYSTRQRAVTLVIESEGAHRVRVDDSPALERVMPFGSVPGEGAPRELDAHLRAGWNRVQVKLAAIGAPGRFRLRAADPSGELFWARLPS